VDSVRIRSLQMALLGCAGMRTLTDRCTRWHSYPVMDTSTWWACSDCVDSTGAQDSDLPCIGDWLDFELGEWKPLGKDSNFGQQTYMSYALKALDKRSASIAIAVVLQDRDQGRPKACYKDAGRATLVWTIISMTGVKAAGRQDMTMTARDKARKPTDTCSRGVHTHRRTRKRQVAVGQPPAYSMIATDARQVGSAPGEYRAAVGGRVVAADTCTPQSMRYVADLGVISP
jgi:hypothetical protein